MTDKVKDRALKAKVHAVELHGKTHLVMALTRQGACRDLAEHLAKDAVADIATGEQLYNAGKEGVPILGEDKYKRVVDPSQLPLSGVDEKAGSGRDEEE